MRAYSLFLITFLVAVFAVAAVSAAEFRPAHNGDGSNARECLKECRAAMPHESLARCARFCSPKLIRPMPLPRPRPMPPVQEEGSEGAKTEMDVVDFQDTAAPSSGALDPSKLWAQYRSLLFDFLRRGDSNVMPNLQLITQPISVDWHNNPAQLNELANRISQPGAFHEWTGRYFVDEYKNYLFNINTPKSTEDPATEARLVAWEDRLAAAEDKIIQAEMTCTMNHAKWEAMMGDRAPAFPKFRSDFCSYQITRAHNSYNVVLSEAERDSYATLGEFYEAHRALAKFVRTTNKDFVPLSNLATFTEKSEAGTTNKFLVKVHEKTEVKTEKESSWNVGIQASIPLFKVNDEQKNLDLGVNYSQGKLNIKTNNKDFQVEVGAGGITYIPVMPSNEWFSSEAINRYKNGPFVQPRNHFAADGMQYVIRGFYVISKPHIVMYVSQVDAEQMRKTSELRVTASVMGQNFNFGKNDRMEVNQTSDKGYRVELIGEDPTPQLLAIDLQKLPY